MLHKDQDEIHQHIHIIHALDRSQFIYTYDMTCPTDTYILGVGHVLGQLLGRVHINSDGDGAVQTKIAPTEKLHLEGVLAGFGVGGETAECKGVSTICQTEQLIACEQGGITTPIPSHLSTPHVTIHSHYPSNIKYNKHQHVNSDTTLP